MYVCSVQFLDTFTQQFSPLVLDAAPLPKELRVAFRLLYLSHFYLACLQRADRYLTHRPAYLAGCTIHFVAGTTPAVKVGAQAVLVARSVLFSSRAALELKHSCDRLYAICTDTFPLPTTFLQKRHLYTRRFTILPHLPQKLAEAALCIHILAIGLIDCITKMFFLSHALLSLFDAVYFNQLTEYESITGLATNTIDVYEQLAGRPHLLAQEIEMHGPLINAIFQCTHSSWTAKDVSGMIRDHIAKVPHLQRRIERVWDHLKDGVQQAVHDHAYLYTGNGLVPGYAPHRPRLRRPDVDKSGADTTRYPRGGDISR